MTTNSDEGSLFITPDVLTANNFTLSRYITELFPRLSKMRVQEATEMYSNMGLTSVPEEASAVIGDCRSFTTSLILSLMSKILAIFVCPALAAVSAFGQNGWKVTSRAPFFGTEI